MDRTSVVIYTLGTFFFFFVVILAGIKEIYWTLDRRKFWLHLVLATAIVVTVTISMYYGYYFIWKM